MVDALRRAHGMVKPTGCVVDLHPTAALASLEVGADITGVVDTGDAPARHAAASGAMSAAIDEGLYLVERTVDFAFLTYGDTVEELRDFHRGALEERARRPGDARSHAQGTTRRCRNEAPRPGVCPGHEAEASRRRRYFFCFAIT